VQVKCQEIGFRDYKTFSTRLCLKRHLLPPDEESLYLLDKCWTPERSDVPWSCTWIASVCPRRKHHRMQPTPSCS